MTISPRDLGCQIGLQLGDPSRARQMARDMAARQVDTDTAEALAVLEQTKELADEQLRKVTFGREKLSHHQEVLTILRTDRLQNPEQFSAMRGLMFLTVGVLAIAGDITFLGGVLATLVGAPLRDPASQLTFARMAFRDPFEALARFPEIFVLTVSVLMTGFCLKLWHDAHRRHHHGRGSDKPWYWAVTAVSGLGVLMLIIVAAVRMWQPLEVSDSIAARAASTILGLVLPVFGTMCMMTAMDKFANLTRVAWHTAWRGLADYQLEPAVRAYANARQQLVQAQQRAAMVQSASYVKQAVAQAETEFNVGYAEGLARALASGQPGSIYALIRKAALGRMATVS
jgi:hypothetical protein